MISKQTVGELNQLFGLKQSTPSRKLRHRWACPVLAQEIGDFFVVPLASLKELASEGRRMQHCVASYETRCVNGMYQVFSIRDLHGNRIATLGLTYGSTGWKVDQCLGISNTEVLLHTVEWIDGNGNHESMDEFTDLHYLAYEVARLLNTLTET
jgi:hypothetical protein